MKKILKLFSIAFAIFLFTVQSSPAGTAMESAVPMPDENKYALPKKTLSGMTICIDAGHGKTFRAKDSMKEPVAPGSREMKAAVASGTMGVATKMSEESLNLTVSMKLKKALADRGAQLIMVRETHDCDLTNVERAKLWNTSGADLTIRIHANGSVDSTVTGVLMMVPGDKYVSDKGVLEKSALAGQFVLDGVLKYTCAKSRGTVKSNELTGFNWSEIPVILLEVGFMTNPEEDRLLSTGEYQDQIVSGIVEGVERYKSFMDKE